MTSPAWATRSLLFEAEVFERVPTLHGFSSISLLHYTDYTSNSLIPLDIRPKPLGSGLFATHSLGSIELFAAYFF